MQHHQFVCFVGSYCWYFWRCSDWYVSMICVDEERHCPRLRRTWCMKCQAPLPTQVVQAWHAMSRQSKGTGLSHVFSFSLVSQYPFQEVSEAAKAITNEASSQLLRTGDKSPSRSLMRDMVQDSFNTFAITCWLSLDGLSILDLGVWFKAVWYKPWDWCRHFQTIHCFVMLSQLPPVDHDFGWHCFCAGEAEVARPADSLEQEDSQPKRCREHIKYQSPVFACLFTVI